MVRDWATAARSSATRAERHTATRLHRLVDDPSGSRFAMRFVDRVIRPDDRRIAAQQLHRLVTTSPLPAFLGPVDRFLLRAGGRLAPHAPALVMPLARRRMRQIVGHLVIDADDEALARHLRARSEEGYGLNVNLLGEAVLGEGEAARHLDETVALAADPAIDYVSVKISSVASQLQPWAWDANLARISDRLRIVLRAARDATTFVNLDMEEYRDLALTVAAFTTVLDEPEFLDVRAGIVLQTYLPDAQAALEQLVEWSGARRARGGAGIKIRLVKGANLAMERVDATMHGWEQAPYADKADTDANYKRCLDWVLTPERTDAVDIGLASHNLFDVAWGLLLARSRGVGDRLGVEMLEGMAAAQSRTVLEGGDGVLLYTPVVRPADFDVAIAYLFRRLEENAAPGNFLRALATLEPGSPSFDAQEQTFRDAVARRHEVSGEPRRPRSRAEHPRPLGLGPFENEPDADPTDPETRAWAQAWVGRVPEGPATPVATEVAEIDRAIDAARRAQREWWRRSAEDRRATLRAVGDALAARRGELLTIAVHEGNKTVAQADPELSEAIDFARYYADRAVELTDDHAVFSPFGVVGVIPPWNFPIAIPTGGMLAALAAGNAVVCKPAPEVPTCAETVVGIAHDAGVPPDLLQIVRTPENDLGRHLVTSVDAVILTGSTETADLFASWKPDIALFAETSGKNAMVVTPNADIDQAVADVVASAFGHAGQKCSAASLLICVGSTFDSPRLRRQLADAVESLVAGPAADPATAVPPLIGRPNPRLQRAFTELDHGESWLVEPRAMNDDGTHWSPGVRIGVRRESWFHTTECFGPVLGVMRADDLDDAIAIQNDSEFGLTGGLHSLDPVEIDRWSERVEVGNAYVNRSITGAIVRRQPFGGWKRSSVGPGAKAGGPGYVRQLGTWTPKGGLSPAAWEVDDRRWQQHFGQVEDPTALYCESNVFRFRTPPAAAIWLGHGATDTERRRLRHAADAIGCTVLEGTPDTDDFDDFADRAARAGAGRIRAAGVVTPAMQASGRRLGVHIGATSVTSSGRLEIGFHLREQCISVTRHRFGNVLQDGDIGHADRGVG